MPLVPSAITAAIQVASPDLKGPIWLQLSSVIGVAVASWAMTPGNLVINGITAGVLGAGTVTGKLFVPPQPIPVTAAMSAAALLGFQSPSVARGIGVGIATALNAGAIYQGVSMGVGVGSDTVVLVTPNPTTLIAAITAAASGSGLLGLQVPELASALGTGISTLLATARGAGVVAGGGGPIPGAGTSISRVV